MSFRRFNDANDGGAEITLLSKLLREKTTVPFIDSLKDPVVILARDGRIVDANAAFLGLVKLPKADVAGRDCREVEPLSRLWNGITASVFSQSGQSEQVSFANLILEVSITPIKSDGGITHVCVLMRDITAVRSLEKDFIRKSRELTITNTLSGAFISSADMHSVFGDLLAKVLLVTDFKVGWVVLKKDENFLPQGMLGMSPGFRRRVEAGNLDGLYRAALGAGEPIYVLEAEEAEKAEELKREGIVFLAALPLRTGKDVYGLLMLASRTETVFDIDLASLLSLTGNTVSLIVEKVRLFQETERLSVTDGLTGLYNVRHFYGVLDAEIARAVRYSTPFSLLLLDIDNFKSTNDTYGHQAGDEVLQAVAASIKNMARKSDIVARYGGEEFIIILPVTHKDDAFILANRIKDAVEANTYLADEALRVTLSGGIATCPEDAADAKSLLYAADMALYEAKARGKKRIIASAAKPVRIE